MEGELETFELQYVNVFCILKLNLNFHRNTQAEQPLLKCQRIFQALIKLAVEELCETADSLITPVRLGVARPTPPFILSTNAVDVVNSSEELFSIEPLIPHSGVSGQSLDAAMQTQQGNNNITISRDVSTMDETEGAEGKFPGLIEQALNLDF